MEAAASHPYYLRTASIPGFVANAQPVTRVAGPVLGAVAASAYALAAARPGQPSRRDGFVAAWFALCAFLHLCFEGYFVLRRQALAGEQTLAAQLWKEYALSDSRYLTGRVFTVCVEALTVLVWGPLCVAAAAAVIGRWPSRHGLQVVVSTAHLYGLALYFATNWAEPESYSRPEFLYAWVYYVGFNLPWAFVPLYLLWDSFTHIRRAFAARPKQS